MQAGVVDLGRAVYQRVGPNWLLAAVLGGVLFGFGMVQAGGCVSRNLVRFGSGSLKALAALLATAAGSGDHLAARAAPSLWRRQYHRRHGRCPPALLSSAALLTWCLLNRRFRRSPADLATGAVLGALVPLGWLATGLGQGEPESVNYLALDRAAFTLPSDRRDGVGCVRHGPHAATNSASSDSPPAVICAGTCSAVRSWAAAVPLALGCTVGQGLSGVSDPGSRFVPGAGGDADRGLVGSEVPRDGPPAAAVSADAPRLRPLNSMLRMAPD